MEEIRIEWDGPYSLEDIGYDEESDRNKPYNKTDKLNDDNIDYGIYQVYGCHPMYGNDVLLYIGKAQEQTFATRLAQEGWESNSDSKNIKFYVGRLFAVEKPTHEEWNDKISKAESILIYAHEPARNSSNVLNVTKNQTKLRDFENIRVLNYNDYRSLMPEVSGELWVKSFSASSEIFDFRELKKQT